MAVKFAKQIEENDNVATCVADIDKGEAVTVRFAGKNTEYIALNDIPFGHKIALKDIAKGEYIYKYGTPIGIAGQPIHTGEWVHTHNCVDFYEVK